MSARLAQDVSDARAWLQHAEDRVLRLRRETAQQEAEVAEAEAALRQAQQRLAEAGDYRDGSERERHDTDSHGRE